MVNHRIIENGGEKEKELILGLRQIVFKEEEFDKQTVAFWDWQFKKNPDGEALIYLLKNGDQIVGHFADTPKRFVVLGKEVLGTLSVDMMVHPEHRGGMFVQLGRYAIKRTKELGFAFLTSYPIRKHSIKSLKQIGWQGLFDLPVLVYPLRFSGIFNRYLRFLPFSLIAGVVARTFYYFFFNGKLEVKKLEIDISGMTDLDDAYDQFWQQAASLHPVMGVRDRVFIHWRYLQHPTRTYRIYRALRKGRMEGYIVLRKVDLLKFNSAVIVDLLSLDEEVLKVLIDTGIEYARDQKVDVLGCIVPRHHRYYRVLRHKGFIPTFKSFLFMVYPHNIGIPLLPKEWYVNWGDSDVI